MINHYGSPKPPVVMVIGGMDPSGGAGLCADIQTLSSMGCHAAPVVTALTVQDTQVVKSFELVDVELIRAQMQTVFDDISPSVIKTGMLGSRDIISVVSEVLRKQPGIQLIVDPVMSSNMNDNLSEHSLSETIKELLMPIAALISPNIPEAAALAGKDLLNTVDTDECAALLYDKDSSCDCLITGTHAESRQVINRYYQQGRKKKEWSWKRLQFEYHGSGCTLASAIAAGVAHGLKMEQAVDQAQRYVIKCLESGFKPGQGQHVPDRLCTGFSAK
jgi:hydroxymethylpyrimidine/phosphomethylpyrimidine kinase